MNKKKKGIAALLVAVMILSLALSGCEQAQTEAPAAEPETVEAETPAPEAETGFAGGSGTAEDPYQIATAEQLDMVREDLGASYVLMADIDLSGEANWTSIGDVKLSAIDMETGAVDFSDAFSGSFDGDGHTISDITSVASADSVAGGLFGCVTGALKNLTVENCEVTGGETNMAVGGVCGYGMGTAENIALKGENTITGINCVGGIVGGNQGKVDGCTVEDADIDVIGDNDFSDGDLTQCDVAECGGLVVGGSFLGTVDNCTASGTVTATGNEPVGLGGIAGCIQCAPSITGNTVTVTIDAKNGHAIGGLCGYAGMGDDGDGVVDEPCAITDCTVNATIHAQDATHVGGLVGTGLYYFGMEDRFTVENCSVTAEINGAVTPGTVAGRAEGSTIISCETSVIIDGAAGTEQIGTTDRLYRGGDQYEVGSEGAAIRLMSALNGTYEELFPVILDAKYDDLWLNTTISCVGEENAQMYVDMLKGSMSGTVIGQAAVDAYASDPESAKFNCDFTGGVETIQFADGVITGLDAEGGEVFSHTYSFVGYDEENDFYEYKTEDADAGEFTYFTMRSDFPASTYHIEFRYGSDLDALLNFYEGDYAYWMAAGILTDGGDAMAEASIQLFCTENLAG